MSPKVKKGLDKVKEEAFSIVSFIQEFEDGEESLPDLISNLAEGILKVLHDKKFEKNLKIKLYNKDN